MQFNFHNRHVKSVLDILSDYVDIKYAGCILNVESNQNVECKTK